MKVVHVVPCFVLGGAERVSTDLLVSMDPARFERAAIVLFAPLDSALEHRLARQEVPIRYLHKRPGPDPRVFARVYTALRELRPDVVHTHGYPLAYCLPAMLALGIPGVHTVHTLAHEEVGRVGRLVNEVAFRSGRVTPVCVSESSARSFSRVYGVQPPPVVPNGIDLQRLAAPRVGRSEWRRAHGLSDTDRVVSMIGRFRGVKNHAEVVRAFADVVRRVPNAHLVLAGDGDLQRDTERLVEDLGLRDPVHFLGPRADVPEILAAADLNLMFSTFEGLPISLLEAMAASRASVVTPVGGIPEVVQDGVHARFVPPTDRAALVRAVVELLEDRELSARMGADARRRVVQRYGIEAMTRTYEGLYAEAAGRAGAPRHRASA